MTEPGTPRVAVYLDFDNIVISRYDQIHGRNSFQRDKAAGFHKEPGRLTTATVDVKGDARDSSGQVITSNTTVIIEAKINGVGKAAALLVEP